MRVFAIVVLALAVTAPAAFSAVGSGPPDPCVLITSSDASSALSATPPKATSKRVGPTRTCTYTVKKKSMMVQTVAVAKESAFVKSAKATRGLVIPIQGVGADAYSAGNGATLLVWKSGVEITFKFVGVVPFVATQQSLAKTAVGRL